MTDETSGQVLSLDQLMDTRPHQPGESETVRTPAEKALILAYLTAQLIQLDDEGHIE